LVLARLHTAIELRYGSGPASASQATNHVLDFFIDLDNLYLKGHMTLDEIDWNWGTSLRVWHALTLDAMEAERQRTGDPALADDLDRLVVRIEARARQRGASAIVIDVETRNGWLDEAIRRNTEILKLLNEAEGHAIPKVPSGVVA
jgi:hypothetical protein